MRLELASEPRSSRSRHQCGDPSVNGTEMERAISLLCPALQASMLTKLTRAVSRLATRTALRGKFRRALLEQHENEMASQNAGCLLPQDKFLGRPDEAVGQGADLRRCLDSRMRWTRRPILQRYAGQTSSVSRSPKALGTFQGRQSESQGIAKQL